MKTSRVLLLLSILFCCGVMYGQINTPSTCTVPFGSNTSYSYGILPSNLPNGGSYGTSQDAADAYNNWKANYIDTCSLTPTKYRVKFDSPNYTVSESVGYGMILSAYAGDKDLFNGLLEYFKSFKNGNGLMCWKINGCSNVAFDGNGSASDADLDIAIALCIASVQWPNESSYSSERDLILEKIRLYDFQTSTEPGPFQTNNGDSWNPINDNCRNPSYQSPAYYKVFAYFEPAFLTHWETATLASYQLLSNNVHPNTGLVSNWCDYDGLANSCNGPIGYGYDACRFPWRMATDATWWNDSNAVQRCSALAGFIQNTGVNNLSAPVSQSGNLLPDADHKAEFVSTWATSIVGVDASYQSLLDSAYTEAVNTTSNSYFGSTLRVLALFQMTGNFWNPIDYLEEIIVDFTVSDPMITEGDSIVFTSFTLGSPTSYFWDFGDGTTDVAQNPAHTYQNPGFYSVSLTVQNNVDTSTITKQDYIYVQSQVWQCGNEFTDDRDSMEYATVLIGDQCWMSENLAYLPAVSPSATYSYSTSNYYVYGYQGTDVAAAKSNLNYQTYGVLYNWSAAGGACPSGWHLPSDDEWKVLEGTVDTQYPVGHSVWNNGSNYSASWRGSDAGTKLKSLSGWALNSNGSSGNGTNDYDFNALPGGEQRNGSFMLVGLNGYFWTSSPYSSKAIGRQLANDQTKILRGTYFERHYSMSVRCMRNTLTSIGLNVTPNECFGGTTGAIDLTITGGLYPEINWSNGATTEDLINLQAGWYSVTVSDTLTQYSIIDSIEVTQPAPITVSTQVTNVSGVFSVDGEIDLTVSGGNQPYSFLWNNGETLEQVQGLAPGIYAVTISDGYNCIETESFEIQQTDSLWQYTNTSTWHTILIPNSFPITVNGQAIQTGDLIGVFYDYQGTELCGGYVEWNNANIDITAFGNDTLLSHKNGFAPNEIFKWKIIRQADNQTYDAQACYMPIAGAITNQSEFVVNGISGLSSLESTSYQSIDLPSGWSIFSTYIDPFEPSLDSVFSSISNIIIIKDEVGQVYWPVWGLNLIGDLVIGEGYQIKLNGMQTITFYGNPVQLDVTPVNLPTGWSLFGYLRNTPAPIDVMLSSIVSDVIIVKNGIGQTYWIQWGINSIENMQPGQGYQIKMANQQQLYYPSNCNSFPSKSSEDQKRLLDLLKPKVTDNNMTLGLETQDLEIGSSIRVYSSSGKMVGSGIVGGDFTAITLWGDDQTSPEIDGLHNGEGFEIRVWNKESQTESELVVGSWMEGDATYEGNKIAIAAQVESRFKEDETF